MTNQVIDPFRYLEELAKKNWLFAGGILPSKYSYLTAVGHEQIFCGQGDDLIHAYIDLKEQIEAWEHEQEDIDAKDEEDTKNSLLAGMHP
jgi:hypothetical protein